MKICPVILAGGSGTRFWPMSRKSSPKQVLNLSGKDTLIGEAVTRFRMISEEEDIHILTTSQSMIQVENALSADSKVKYILEPVARGTAACILLAALKLHKQYGDCIVCISPSDHYITKPDEFSSVIHKAIQCASESESIVTIGVNPTFPSTGYGYIACDYATNPVMLMPFWNSLKSRRWLKQKNICRRAVIFGIAVCLYFVPLL